MSEIFIIILVWVTGFLLGVIFFAGLGWTISKGTSSKRSALWFLGSFFIRTSIVLAGFYFVSSDHFERFLLCLLGFIVARLFVMRFTCLVQEEDRVS